MATTSQAMRARYAESSVGTASPARLLTMLYDRLVRDLVVVEAAIEAADSQTANNELLHAQAIIDELSSSLVPDAWDGGSALAELYTYIRSELVAANVGKDGAKVTACRDLLEPLRDAWYEAMEQSR